MMLALFDLNAGEDKVGMSGTSWIATPEHAKTACLYVPDLTAISADALHPRNRQGAPRQELGHLHD